MNKELNVSLCNGRHVIPEAVDGSIFGTIVNPLDVEGLEETAFQSLGDICKSKGFVHPSSDYEGDDLAEWCIDKDIVLNVFVTGMTVALIALINACHKDGIYNIILMHYDRDSNTYYPQSVYGQKRRAI